MTKTTITAQHLATALTEITAEAGTDAIEYAVEIVKYDDDDGYVSLSATATDGRDGEDYYTEWCAAVERMGVDDPMDIPGDNDFHEGTWSTSWGYTDNQISFFTY